MAAGTVFLVDAVGGAPTYPGRKTRQTVISPSVAQATGTRPLGGLSGVRPGTPTTIATATSTTWTVTPFLGMLDGATAAIAGVYSYAFDTNQTGGVNAAGASARTDRLDVQVVDPAEGGVAGVNPLIQIVYTPGAPGLAAAPAQSHPLAQINVPATGGGSPTVTWTAPYYVAPGAIQPVRTVAERNALTGGGVEWPQYVDRLDVGVVQRAVGGSYATVTNSPWVAYTPTLANLTIGTGGSALTFAEWRYEGDLVHVHFTYTIGTTGPSVGTIPTMTLPVASKAETVPLKYWGTTTYYDVSAPQYYEGRVSAVSGSQTTARLLAFPSSVGVPQPVTSAAPFTWAPADTMEGDFWYRPASV